jgi:hypothetical protein
LTAATENAHPWQLALHILPMHRNIDIFNFLQPEDADTCMKARIITDTIFPNLLVEVYIKEYNVE